MLNLSIMPLDVDHLDEVCSDIVEQQRTGVSTHAMFMMKFNPEQTPAANKAELQCRKYDLFKERLDKAGAKHGVLVQATLGHITVPSSPYPFQPSVSLITGEDRVVTCCPLDPNFREYIKGQFRVLASRHPSVVMLDDDLGLFYKATKGCACKYHMAEFNRRAGTNMTREELYMHTQGNSEQDKRYTEIYVEVNRDALVGCVAAMREGLDEVDPYIQGVVSGIYTTTFCEFSGDTATAFAGKGNPKIIRLNGGPYSNSIADGGARFFTQNMFRAAILRENVKDKVDLFLAETDTCPQNRYSTSAALLHSHFTASVLEGATGAKHWITRLASHEPASGKAYRKKLAKYAKFYEAMTKYAAELKPFGCRIPLTLKQDYQFTPSSIGNKLSPWSSCVLERFGLPLYFANEGEGAVFLDGISVNGFDDDTVREFFRGTLVLTATAADALNSRGFADNTGVAVSEWQGPVITGESIGSTNLSSQYEKKCLTPTADNVRALSNAVRTDPSNGEKTVLFPAVTSFANPLGGKTVVFCGNVDMPYKYFTAFSMLNETRKRQIIEILNEDRLLPLYYPGDEEVYLRAGYLKNGSMLAALFNLSQDEIEQTVLTVNEPIGKAEYLDGQGDLVPITYRREGNELYLDISIPPMTPAVIILSK